MTTTTLSTTLKDILHPVETDVFLRSTWQKKFLYIPGPPTKLGGLFDWRELNRILNEHQLDEPRIRLFRDGAQRPRETYAAPREPRKQLLPATEVRPHRLARELAGGSTLFVHAIGEISPNVGELAYDLQRMLDSAVNVNLYAAWRRDRGFKKHWDDHDVFILQISGRKRWEIYPCTRPHPIAGDPLTNPPAEAVWAGTVTPGDVLYIPRGWWHVACPTGEPCLHLTVGVLACTGLDFLEWLKHRLAEAPLFRSDLPVARGDEPVETHLRALRAALIDRWPDGTAAEYLASRTENVTPARMGTLPESPTTDPLPADDVKLRLSIPRRLRIENPGDVRAVTIRAMGRKRWFPADAAGMIEKLVSGEPATVADLLAACGPGLDDAERRRVLRDIVCEGLVGRA